jgi:hypothetical protein
MMLINATHLDRKSGGSPPQLFVPGPIACSLGPKPTRTPPRLLRSLQGPGAPTGEEMKLPKIPFLEHFSGKHSLLHGREAAPFATRMIYG